MIVSAARVSHEEVTAMRTFATNPSASPHDLCFVGESAGSVGGPNGAASSVRGL